MTRRNLRFWDDEDKDNFCDDEDNILVFQVKVVVTSAQV
jgi:hypothetical protein